MAAKTTILLNPAAHQNGVGRAWEAVQRKSLEALSPAEIRVVGTREEARQAAADAAREGCEKIIAVGGAETSNGMVTAVMELAPTHRKALKIGFLSVHRTHTFSRTIGFPRPIQRQLEVLKAGNTLPFDVGLTECLDDEGHLQTHYFVNGAAFGVLSQIRKELGRGLMAPLESIRVMKKVVQRAMSREEPWVKVEQHGREVFRGPWLMGVVMVGRYYPLLGRVAPHADPQDGLLDLVGITGYEKWELIQQISGLLLRNRGGREMMTLQTGDNFKATTLEGRIVVEVDGQTVGRLPATFTILPKTLPVIVEQAPARITKPQFDRLPDMASGDLASTDIFPR